MPSDKLEDPGVRGIVADLALLLVKDRFGLNSVSIFNSTTSISNRGKAVCLSGVSKTETELVRHADVVCSAWWLNHQESWALVPHFFWCTIIAHIP